MFLLERTGFSKKREKGEEYGLVQSKKREEGGRGMVWARAKSERKGGGGWFGPEQKARGRGEGVVWARAKSERKRGLPFVPFCARPNFHAAEKRNMPRMGGKNLRKRVLRGLREIQEEV